MATWMRREVLTAAERQDPRTRRRLLAGTLGAAADARSLSKSQRPGQADMLIVGAAAFQDAELVTCDAGFAVFPDSLRVTVLAGNDH